MLQAGVRFWVVTTLSWSSHGRDDTLALREPLRALMPPEGSSLVTCHLPKTCLQVPLHWG